MFSRQVSNGTEFISLLKLYCRYRLYYSISLELVFTVLANMFKLILVPTIQIRQRRHTVTYKIINNGYLRG